MRFLLARTTTLALIASVFASQGGAQTPATPPAAPASPTEPALASYLSSRINGKPLPVTDRATDEGGVQYLIEFDELILSLRPSHEFRASLRYRQTLAAKGGQLGRDPIQKMTVYGTWIAVGGELRFTPDPKRGGSGLRILSGTFSGTRIEVPFDYRNGSVARRASVVLVKNDNIF
jgi:hypothetical protein